MLAAIGPASLVILVVNIGLSLAAFGNRQLLERLVFRPHEFARGRRRYTIVTSGFVHADLPHLVFNMVTFYFFGATLLEHTIGTTRFVVLYVLGLLLSEVLSFLKHRDNSQYATLGASGAISAVLFAAIVYYPTQNLYLFFALPIPATVFAVTYLVYSWWAARQNKGLINHDAHFGGAVVGLAFVAVTEPAAWGRALRMLFG